MLNIGATPLQMATAHFFGFCCLKRVSCARVAATSALRSSTVSCQHSMQPRSHAATDYYNAFHHAQERLIDLVGWCTTAKLSEHKCTEHLSLPLQDGLLRQPGLLISCKSLSDAVKPAMTAVVGNNAGGTLPCKVPTQNTTTGASPGQKEKPPAATAWHNRKTSCLQVW